MIRCMRGISSSGAALSSFLTTMQTEFNQLLLIKLSNYDKNREQREHLLYNDNGLLQPDQQSTVTMGYYVQIHNPSL